LCGFGGFIRILLITDVTQKKLISTKGATYHSIECKPNDFRK